MPVGGSTWTETQDGLDETFEKPNKKKSKKKNQESKESIVLQTLKTLRLKRDGESDDDTTHHLEYGGGSESETATKVNNGVNQDDSQPAKVKRKSKRELPGRPLPDGVPGAEAGGLPKEVRRSSRKGKDVAEGDDDGLLREHRQQMAPQDQETQVPEALGKKNKKNKLKSATTESDIGDHDQHSDAESDSKDRKKKKKKKSSPEEGSIRAVPKKPIVPDENDGLVLGVYVHRTDGLKTDLRISHPMVKVHVVDEVTGQYVKKQDSHRPVSSFYEQDRVDHILPIMTQPFDFKKNKSVVPEWNEQIIFNEPFSHFVGQDPKSPRVVLFFEVLDFLTMEEAKANVDVEKHERGFRKIAWAFLKLVGANGVLNTGSKIRLQLYCPPTWAKRQPHAIEVVDWWRHYSRVKYASTLYVTVKGIKLPEHVDPSVRSMMALQEERGSASFGELQDGATKGTSTPRGEEKSPPAVKWSRIPGQMCRIPNKPMLAFRGGQMGCLTVVFSHAGTLLAAACADRDLYPVVVFEIPSGKPLAAFSGHLKIVYELCWSADDRRLLSVSSDGTVREWDVEHFLPTARKVLPHPSFVYSAQYHPAAQHLVVSGGYDCVLRTWRLDVDDVNGSLLREFESHGSFINSICFDAEGHRMFSADNAGSVVMWNTSVADGEQEPWHHWCVEKVHTEADLKGVPINMLRVHPNGRCLLIHAKDNLLRTLDLRIKTMKKYTGATNQRERIHSTFTPCGSFIFSGSEDGMAYVWNAETGDQVAAYSELCYSAALRGVSFHPLENMVAFCAFGESQPVHVYIHDRKVSQLDARGTKELRSASHTPDQLQSTPVSASMDQLGQTTRLALRMQRVKEQMDSVLEPHRRPSSFEPGRSLFSDISTIRSNASLPPPLGGFSPVGLHRKGVSSFRLHSSLPSYDPEADSSQHVVASQYDYKANRSDELTLRRGDAIRVLYKDNDNWWFGSLADGQQGYFLAAYVADQRESGEDATAAEAAAERATPTRISTAITRSGDLHFLSEATVSDTEPELTEARLKKKPKVRKNVKRLPPPPPPGASQAAFSDPDVGTEPARPAARPLPKRPSGRPGVAVRPPP
ncbi:jouberin isoform X2 [Syngnathoides biaculeatus]|uniref:jouberin isoform X2 n=1 Tax=Syngnathoides biaculeatus TaxID=300417 RepID=UPI002ADD45F0|nr:jouberin isoform X2 [Syngnathoides biaculeatus]